MLQVKEITPNNGNRQKAEINNTQKNGLLVLKQIGGFGKGVALFTRESTAWLVIVSRSDGLKTGDGQCL